MTKCVKITYRRADGILSSLSVPVAVHSRFVRMAAGDVRLVHHLLRRATKSLIDISPGDRSRISREIVEHQLLLRQASSPQAERHLYASGICA